MSVSSESLVSTFPDRCVPLHTCGQVHADTKTVNNKCVCVRVHVYMLSVTNRAYSEHNAREVAET